MTQEGGNFNTDPDMHRRKMTRRDEGNRQLCEDEGQGQSDMSTIQGVPKAVGQRSTSA